MDPQTSHATTKQRDEHLILASSSSSRKRLLKRFGLPFIALAPDIDETALEHEQADALALRLAKEKAECIQKDVNYSNHVIIGSDQTVCCDGKIFGKPHTAENAEEQLKFFSGKTVTFNSAICVLSPEANHTELMACHVKYQALSVDEIKKYVHREQPFACAGSIMFERLGPTIVESAQSPDPTALEGFPLILLSKLLKKVGVPVL